MTTTTAGVSVTGTNAVIGGATVDINVANLNADLTVGNGLSLVDATTTYDGSAAKTIKIEPSATAGYILSTVGGTPNTVAWVAPGSVTVNEVDPQVGALTDIYVPVWSTEADPDQLVNGLIQDNGTTVSVGGALSVSGTSTLTGNVDANGGLDVTGAALTAAAGVNFTGTGFGTVSTDNNVLTYNTGTGAVGYRPFAEEAIQVVNGSSITLAFGTNVFTSTAAPGTAFSLPSASGNAGKKLYVKRIGGANFSVSGGGAQIDGTTTPFALTNYQSYLFQTDGSNWYIIAFK